MEAKKPYLWDQQEQEPDAAYVRFLFYRNIGPGRSLLRAYVAFLRDLGEPADSVERRKIPGQWYTDSRVYDWVRRGRAWDIHAFQAHAKDAVVAYSALIRRAALKALERLEELDGPADWKEMMETIGVLSNLIPTETIQSFLHSYNPGDDGDDASAEEQAGIQIPG